jgi:protein TonB
MARRKKKLSTVYVVSIAAHLAVGAVLALVPQDKLREVVAIALNEAKPPEKKAEPPKPPPHAAERPVRAVGHNPRPALAAAAAATPNAGPQFADIGLALDSNSADGIAVNIGPPVTAAPAVVFAPPKPKVLIARRTEAVCNEDLVKAHMLSMIKPSYTDDARRSHVEGRIRIELLVNEMGEVTEARILSGLGHGLDEAALEAARRLHFSPAMQCGRAVSAPFIIAMRFALPK